MRKALLHKQFLELNQFYFVNKKNGNQRSKGGTTGMIILFVFVFICAALLFFMLGNGVAILTKTAGMPWLYYALMGLSAILFGVFGSVFNTYAALYKAKDNDMLLSMPIPVDEILFVRMLGVFAMSLLYTSLVWIPGIIAYIINFGLQPLGLIFSVINIVTVTMIVTVLTCLLGWLVALASNKLKNKNIAIVVFTVIFFVFYYYVCFNMQSVMETILQNSAAIGNSISHIWPLYILGKASAGDLVSMAIFVVISVVLFLIGCKVMSATFIKIITTTEKVAKVEFKAGLIKKNTVEKTLFDREKRHFLSSPTYMLNAGLIIMLMPILTVVLIYNVPQFYEVLREFEIDSQQIQKYLSLAIEVIMLFMISTNVYTAPSISLEGKNLWIVRSLPVKTSSVLAAKERFGILLSVPMSVICTICIGIAFKISILEILLCVAIVIAYTILNADIGLMLNLKMPNLNWTSEGVPIKQSMAVFITLFGGWLVSVVAGVLGFLLIRFIGSVGGLLVNLAIFTIILVITRRWVFTKGIAIFEKL